MNLTFKCVDLALMPKESMAGFYAMIIIVGGGSAW